MRRLARSTRALLTFGLAVAISGVAGWGTTPARAQAPDDAFGGFTLVARANPVQFTYDSPGLLPVSPVVQMSVPEALATQASGPQGYSLASLAFPGPLIADLASALAQTGDCAPPDGVVPIYPVRAEAFHPQEPGEAEAQPVPGTLMRATASSASSTASASYGGPTLEPVFAVGAIRGTSVTEVVSGEAVTRARSVVSGISILGGLITIEAVITDVLGVSTGEDGRTEGSTTVTGLRIADVPATVDENGVRALNPVGAVLNMVLEQAGITIRLVEHREAKEGGLVERFADGLQIHIAYDGQTAPLLSDLIGAVPLDLFPDDPIVPCNPFSPQALVALLGKTHLQTLSIGGATVNANASGAFLGDFDDGPEDVLDDGGDFEVGLGDGFGDLPGDFTEFGGVPGPLPDAPVGTGGATGPVGFPASTVTGIAIPAGLIVLLLAAAPFLYAGSRRLAESSFVPPAATGCPQDPGGSRD